VSERLPLGEERLIDESVLRRALRLEPDERGPRLDAAALRARAGRGGALAPAVAFAGSLSIALLGLAALVAATRFAVDLVSLVLGGDALGSAIALIAIVAGPLEVLLAIATQPAVPIAIVACLIVAALTERRLATEDMNA